MPHPATRLTVAIQRAGSPVCVGLDPVLESLPEDLRARHQEPLAAIADFCRGVLQALIPATGAAPIVPALKFQSACFERYGGKGFTLLEDLMAEAARLGFIVIWDAKRGDISTSAAHYAAAAQRLHAHWVTVNPYLGSSGIQPFLDAGLGVFALARTSNPDSDAIQSPQLTDGRPVAHMVAAHLASLGRASTDPSGLSALGAVVGATKSSEAAVLRQAMPDQVFLIPGYGAQGGTADDIRAMLRPQSLRAPRGREGILVTASRSIIFAKPTSSQTWREAIQAAATNFAREVSAILPTP